MMGRRVFSILLLLVVVFAAGLLAAPYLLPRLGAGRAAIGPTPAVSLADTRALAPPGASGGDPLPLTGGGSIAAAAARVEPSVVTIDTSYRPQMQYGVSGPYLIPRQAVPRGTGSGVILSADGTIVTNNHVVENAETIHVTLNDGRELEGRVVGADAESDLAVVKVDEKNLPAVELGDSDKVQVGEWVVAVGDPLRVGTTVTAGIISAIRKGGAGDGRSESLNSAIQTDAAINPGNSGGALADIQGRLLGINTAIASTNGGSIGIGFAIPVNTVREIADQLIKNGRVSRPQLGISFGPLTARVHEALNIPQNVKGVLVGDVLRGGPADQAGIRPGDVVRQADGQTLTTPDDLQKLVQTKKVGDALSLVLWRAGREQTVTATLRERPSAPPASG